MSNPDEGQVSFDANGATWTLEITNRTERAIQARLKRPMGHVMAALTDGDVTVLQAVFHESLKKHHPDVKEDQAIDLVRPKELRRLVSAVLETTYPPPAEENPPTPGQEGGTGSAN